MNSYKHLLFKSFVLLNIIQIICSCDFESDQAIIDDMEEQYKLYDYYVDSYGNEGIVAFLSSSYVMVVSLDQSYEVWGPMGEALSDYIFQIDTIDLSLNLPKFGLAVLQRMKSIGIERYPAQFWCDKKNQYEKYPGAGSWRLPNVDELKNILNRTPSKINAINSAIINSGGTPIEQDGMYWTCYEDNVNIRLNSDNDYDTENRAVALSALKTDTYDKDRWLKKNKNYVRAIKYIYNK